MKKVAVILAGSGVFDGSEINEVVLTLLHLTKASASYQCFAPDKPQHHVLNHLTGATEASSRNVLQESARIARGEVQALTELQVEEFDALIIPGGFGVAKNLCDFALQGAAATLDTEVKRVCTEFAEQGKPAGYMCIAPALLPLVYPAGIKLTIGNDADTAAALQQMGAEHIECTVDDIVVDAEHKVVTTPAYMLAQSVAEADVGIGKLVTQVLAWS